MIRAPLQRKSQSPSTASPTRSALTPNTEGPLERASTVVIQSGQALDT